MVKAQSPLPLLKYTLSGTAVKHLLNYPCPYAEIELDCGDIPVYPGDLDPEPSLAPEPLQFPTVEGHSLLVLVNDP